jgi:hypothetical protein
MDHSCYFAPKICENRPKPEEGRSNHERSGSPRLAVRIGLVGGEKPRNGVVKVVLQRYAAAQFGSYRLMSKAPLAGDSNIQGLYCLAWQRDQTLTGHPQSPVLITHCNNGINITLRTFGQTSCGAFCTEGAGRDGSAPAGRVRARCPHLMPSAAAVPRAVISHEIAGRRAVGTMPSHATGLIISALVGRGAEQSGSPDRRVRRIGREITGKEAVGGKVAVVVAAVIVPRVIGGNIPPQKGPAACRSVRPRVLGKSRFLDEQRQRADGCQDRCGCRSNFAHAGTLICIRAGSLPNRPSSPQACRGGIADRARHTDWPKRCL